MLKGTKLSAEEGRHAASPKSSDKERTDLTRRFGGKYFLDVKTAIDAGKRDGYGLPSPLSPNTAEYPQLSPCSKVEKKYELHGETLPDDWRDKYDDVEARGKLRVIAYQKQRSQAQAMQNDSTESESNDKESAKKAALGM